MQNMLDIVYEWCRKVNCSMIKVMHFRKKNLCMLQYVFFLDGAPLSYEDHYKYLGVIFEEHLDFYTCGGLWGHKLYKKTEAVEKRALRYIGVYKLTSIPAIEGDVGWLPPPYYRHKLESIRLWNRLITVLELSSPRIEPPTLTS